MQSDSGNRLQAGREEYSTKRRGVVVVDNRWTNEWNGRTNDWLDLCLLWPAFLPRTPVEGRE
jgi:hypothetical protein